MCKWVFWALFKNFRGRFRGDRDLFGDHFNTVGKKHEFNLNYQRCRQRYVESCSGSEKKEVRGSVGARAA
jgi:hypothetical protein